MCSTHPDATHGRHVLTHMYAYACMDVSYIVGWRSWNLYGEDVDQELMIRVMDGMVSRTRTVDGVPTSLCDLGIDLQAPIHNYMGFHKIYCVPIRFKQIRPRSGPP